MPIRALIPALVLLAFAPALIPASPHAPNWDELYFIHRAVCLNRTAMGLDLDGIAACIRAMHKSPIVSALLLPMGSVQDQPERIRWIGEALTILIFSQVVVLAWICQRLPVRVAPLLAAAACIVLNFVVTAQAGRLFA